MSLKSLLIVSALGIVGAAHAVSLAVWNFNDAANSVNSAANTASLFSVDRGTGTMTSTFTSTSITAFAGSTVNADSGDASGQALALQDGTVTNGVPANAGANLSFSTSTVGYSKVQVTFATQRTATGFDLDQFQYSLDGVNFINFGSAYTPPAAFALQSFDLSGISGLTNDAKASFRIVFSASSAITPSTAGNNRIDNLVISATPIQATPEPSAFAALGVGALALLRRRRKA